MSSLRKRVGRNLRSIRVEKGLTQEELAEQIGLTVESISNIERGIQAPSFNTLEALENALDTPVWKFFRL